MWIRTEDKCELIYNTQIKIVPFISINGVAIEKYFIKGNDDVVLGLYYSKERALEVLDEIQDLLEDIINDRIIEKIYQMPKE